MFLVNVGTVRSAVRVDNRNAGCFSLHPCKAPKGGPAAWRVSEILTAAVGVSG